MIHVLNSESICINCGGKGGKPGPCKVATLASPESHTNHAKKLSTIALAGRDSLAHDTAAAAHAKAQLAHMKAGNGPAERYHGSMVSLHNDMAKTFR